MPYSLYLGIDTTRTQLCIKTLLWLVQLEGLTKSIRMVVRVYLIKNAFLLARKGLLRLCENVAARRAYKVY